MFGKNEIPCLSGGGGNRKVDEIINDFMNERRYKKTKTSNISPDGKFNSKPLLSPNSSILNSTAFTECLNSIRADSRVNSNISLNITSGFSDFLSSKKKNIKDKFCDYTRSLDVEKHKRMEKKEKKLMNNVNVMNYRYKDVESNNHMVNFLPRFKKIYKYNQKAENIYSGKDYEDSKIMLNSTKSEINSLNNSVCSCHSAKSKSPPGELRTLSTSLSSPRKSKVTVLHKINQYKEYFNTKK